MTQVPIPFLFMRGGSSRGPYFKRTDLPEDMSKLSNLLVKVIGAGNPRNIDGLGGGSTVTTKVAMLSKSKLPNIDVDYFFAQVGVENTNVDFGPTCGNILVGVGPAAIELGLVSVADDETTVRIHAVNTGAKVQAVVQTPNGSVNYDGDKTMDGVPGTAAPVKLKFSDVVGSKCGSMLPTGNAKETIEDVEVTCIDVAMPMVIGKAEDFGIGGYESQSEIDDNRKLFEKLEKVRVIAGKKMGLDDVSNSVIPKFGLVSPAKLDGNFNARYFMPWKCHPSLAVTGGQCLAACSLVSGTVLDGMTRPVEKSPAKVMIEHPVGKMELTVEYDRHNGNTEFVSASLERTARLIARGEVMVPKDVL